MALKNKSHNQDSFLKITVIACYRRTDRVNYGGSKLAKLVRAALCRRCLTAVGHYFGPSIAVQTVSDSRRPLFYIFLVRAKCVRPAVST
jgi:hypothetical protein